MGTGIVGAVHKMYRVLCLHLLVLISVIGKVVLFPWFFSQGYEGRRLQTSVVFAGYFGHLKMCVVNFCPTKVVGDVDSWEISGI